MVIFAVVGRPPRSCPSARYLTNALLRTCTCFGRQYYTLIWDLLCCRFHDTPVCSGSRWSSARNSLQFNLCFVDLYFSYILAIFSLYPLLFVRNQWNCSVSIWCESALSNINIGGASTWLFVRCFVELGQRPEEHSPVDLYLFGDFKASMNTTS